MTTSELSQTWSNTIIALLQDAAAQDQCYVLVDCAQQSGYPQSLFKSYPTVPWRSLFAASNEEMHLTASPLLFMLDPQQDWFKPLITRLASDGFEQPLFTLLTSTVNIDQLATHLGQYTHALLNKQDAVVIRFYDPRILPRFVEILSEEQRGHFLKPITQWWYVGRDAHIHTIGGGASIVPEAIRELMLTQQQEDALAAVSLPDHIINALRDDFEQKFEQRTEYSLYQDAKTMIAAATKYGVVAWGDLRLFCACGFSTAVSFYEVPSVAKALEAIVKENVALGTAINSISPDIWEEIASGKRIQQ